MVIPESFFIGISFFIVAIYLLMIYLGYKRGLLYELVSLLYTALALFIAWFAAPVLASLLQLFDISKVSDKYALLNKVLNLNSLLNTAAYFLIIFLIMRLLYLFISLLVKGFNKIPGHRRHQPHFRCFVGRGERHTHRSGFIDAVEHTFNQKRQSHQREYLIEICELLFRSGI